MRAHLAAVDAVYLSHLFLDERMAGLALHGVSTRIADDVERVPCQPWIMNHVGARMVLEDALGQQADDVIAPR